MASTVPTEGSKQFSETQVGAGKRNGARSSGAKSHLKGSGRSPLGTLTGVCIESIGSWVPETIVRNEDLAELGYDAQWIVQRTGIQERRRAAPNESTSDVAYRAALDCLANANVAADELDLIILATMTPDMPMPSTACNLQRRLGATAPAMDLNAACAGFMYALVTGVQFVHGGCFRKVLVVGADLMTRTVDPGDPKTFPLFGDGAGAVLLVPGDKQQGLLSFTLGAEGDGGRSLSQPAGGTKEPISPQVLAANRQYMRMDGRAVFKWAVRMLFDSINDVLQYAELTVDDLDLVVLHQANVRIIDSAIDDLKIPRDKVVVNLQQMGNTSAASIPLALDLARQQGRIQPGSRVLFCGFGAGLAWGTAILQW